jgi:hypothetical protein
MKSHALGQRRPILNKTILIYTSDYFKISKLSSTTWPAWTIHKRNTKSVSNIHLNISSFKGKIHVGTYMNFT